MHKSNQRVRRLSQILIKLLQRIGLWNFWPFKRAADPAPTRGSTRTLQFESLEPRLLMSADLMPVSINTASLSAPLYSTDSPIVSVMVRNQGDVTPSQPVVVDLYGTPSSFSGGGAVKLGTATLAAAALQPNGADAAASITLDLGQLALPGTYDLQAVVDPAGLIPESNEANNTTSVAAALTLAGLSGNPAGGNAGLALNDFAVLTPAASLSTIPTSKYFVLPSQGANYLDFALSYGTVSLQGQDIVFVGSSAVDAVFVRPGVSVDFTLSGAGAD